MSTVWPQIISGVFCCPGHPEAYQLGCQHHCHIGNQGVVPDAQEQITRKQRPERSGAAAARTVKSC